MVRLEVEGDGGADRGGDAMTKTQQQKEEASAARLKAIISAEDKVTLRLADPWVDKLHDLVLFKMMYLHGIRFADIEKPIREEARKAIPVKE
jgi:hypothetical protein